MNALSRLDRALTSTPAPPHAKAQAGDLTAMLRMRRQWESEVHAQGADTEDIKTGCLTGLVLTKSRRR